MSFPSEHNRSQGRRRRRAYVLVATIVCLTVVMVIATAWIRAVLRERRFVHAEARAVRAEYLAASGVERARAQLAADEEYSGEIWRIDSAELGTPDTAIVTIEVAPDPADPSTRRVRAVADYPEQGLARVRRTREAAIALQTNEGAP